MREVRRAAVPPPVLSRHGDRDVSVVSRDARLLVVERTDRARPVRSARSRQRGSTAHRADPPGHGHRRDTRGIVDRGGQGRGRHVSALGITAAIPLPDVCGRRPDSREGRARAVDRRRRTRRCRNRGHARAGAGCRSLGCARDSRHGDRGRRWRDLLGDSRRRGCGDRGQRPRSPRWGGVSRSCPRRRGDARSIPGGRYAAGRAFAPTRRTGQEPSAVRGRHGGTFRWPGCPHSGTPAPGPG